MYKFFTTLKLLIDYLKDALVSAQFVQMFLMYMRQLQMFQKVDLEPIFKVVLEC